MLLIDDRDSKARDYCQLFLQAFSERKLKILQGAVLALGLSVGNIASWCSLREVCWEHQCSILHPCNPEEDEVLVSQVTDTPHLYLLWKLWGLGTSNIVSIGNKQENENFGGAELGSGVFPESSHSVYYPQRASGWLCWILNAINCFIRKNDGIQLKLWMSAHSVAILFGSCVSSSWKPMHSVYYCYYIDWKVP